MGELVNSFREITKKLQDSKARIKQEDSKEKIGLEIERLKKLEEELVQLEKFVILGRLVRGVIHELRNPLGVINTSAYYMKTKIEGTRAAEENPKLIKHIKIIEKEISWANNMIVSISDFSRPPVLMPASTDINKIINQAFLEVKAHQLAPKEIQVVKNLSHEVGQIVADEKQLQKAFYHIMLNAFEAMPDGGSLTIATFTRDEGRETKDVCVSFADTGCGIPEENVGKSFDPLFTGKNREVGLGLTICKDIITKHDGSIDIKSKEGEGTTVTVKLPLGEEVKL